MNRGGGQAALGRAPPLTFMSSTTYLTGLSGMPVSVDLAFAFAAGPSVSGALHTSCETR